MPMTNAEALSRAWAMIEAIGTLFDGLAQYNVAQARFYIASLYDLGLLNQAQFDDLMSANVQELNDWETH
ncbi:hypothetical protein [Pseudomonas syringae]|uniref:hypothetical protein n=1 Tax=Pseudomonas syringae TaxID=317 RepID=UPI00040D304D|nr:hypothetical protein [Pseudomonas syringae]